MRKNFLIPIIAIGIISSFFIYKTTTMPKIPENFEIQQLPANIGVGKEELLIGVISDTHIPDRKKALPSQIKEVFKEVDLIIHAGDLTNLETLEELKKIAPVIAVKGNMDSREVKEKLPGGIMLKIYDWNIGIVHSPTTLWLISHLDFGEKLAERLAKKENFDILIFGHTHRSHLEEINLDGKDAERPKNILLLNPGSPTAPFFHIDKVSVGLLRITKDSFKGEIISLEK